ncbi:MAG: single-stranded-DNA-specific exonuclease RecJ, partial [Clostridiales bacterium]
FLDKDALIAILGDYDADGIMSTVILGKTIDSLGGNFLYHIPQRDKEGYGLNNQGIKEMKDKGVELLLVCDNGTSSLEEVEYANSLGLTVIIIDHHDIVLEYDDNGEDFREILPQAQAFINHKQKDCPYPFKSYCAAGLCFRFSQALYEYLGEDWQDIEKELLPFATIATICDLMDLKSDNRIIVKRGLPLLTNPYNIGLSALIEAAGVDGKKLGVYHVGFILGPCINASGRLETADLAVELFLTDDTEKALSLAAYLVELNNERKTITSKGVESALENIEKNNFDKDKVMVIHCPDIAESVAGIVAGRLKELYYRPTIVLGGNEEIVKGSCRSIEAFNISQALRQTKEHLVSFGGHPMAAGVSIKRENIPTFRKAINDNCLLQPEDMVHILRIDYVLSMDKADMSLAKELEKFEPLGKGNHIPYFACKNAPAIRINLLGREAQVMKIQFKGDGYHLCEAISFDGKERLYKMIADRYGEKAWQNLLLAKAAPIPMDIIYTIGINEYNGKKSLHLQRIDFRLSRIKK